MLVCSTRPRVVVGLGKSARSRKPSRTRSPRGKSPSGRTSRWPCKDYLKGACTNSFCEKWHPPVCFDEGALTHTARLKNGVAKGSKNNRDKSAVALLKRHEQHQRTGRLVLDAFSSNTRQLGCVFQDMTPPKSILRKCTYMRKPIQRVKFTKAIARHTKIRDQSHSLGMTCAGEPHERSPNASKFEDRS